MFDIKEYYEPQNFSETENLNPLNKIDDLIREEINYFIKMTKHNLYEKDLYRYENHQIEICKPSISYPFNNKYLSTSDNIRSLLSLYPIKNKIKHINNIILKPKHISKENIKLLAMYIRKTGTLILYLSPTHFYEIDNSKDNTQNKQIEKSIEKYNFGNRIINYLSTDSEKLTIHPLWHILSTIEKNNQEHIDKFFLRDTNIIKNENITLNQISNYYEERGY